VSNATLIWFLAAAPSVLFVVVLMIVCRAEKKDLPTTCGRASLSTGCPHKPSNARSSVTHHRALSRSCGRADIKIRPRPGRQSSGRCKYR
jgi:hypothetical protein